MASGQLAIISQKTKLAEAIRYALSLWDGLRRFTDDGRIEMINMIAASLPRTVTQACRALMCCADIAVRSTG
jgi:hypothetical protein